MSILANTAQETTDCRRCGLCCRKGGPALHRADLPLFGSGGLELAQVLTLRAGEPALDQVRGQVAPLGCELIKLKGADGNWTCVLFDTAQNACTLYERRPAECRALFCQDTTELAAMYDAERLSRRDLLPPGHAILAVLAEHDALVPAGRVAPLAAALRTSGQEALDAAEELTRMALADQAFRRALQERAGIGPELHDFFLGRTAAALYASAGIALRDDARAGLRVQPDPLWRDQ